MSHDALSGEQFGGEGLYHGTARDITDRVLPSEAVGHKGQSQTHEQALPGGGTGTTRDVAHATTSEKHAWFMAKMATAPKSFGNPVGGRARVYEVAPHPDMVPGVRAKESEMVAPHFDVKRQIDIQPGHQGTFPEVNWREFVPREPGVDPNHPRPGQEQPPSSLSAEEFHRHIEQKRNAGKQVPGQQTLF